MDARRSINGICPRDQPGRERGFSSCHRLMRRAGRVGRFLIVCARERQARVGCSGNRGRRNEGLFGFVYASAANHRGHNSTLSGPRLLKHQHGQHSARLRSCRPRPSLPTVSEHQHHPIHCLFGFSPASCIAASDIATASCLSERLLLPLVHSSAPFVPGRLRLRLRLRLTPARDPHLRAASTLGLHLRSSRKSQVASRNKSPKHAAWAVMFWS